MSEVRIVLEHTYGEWQGLRQIVGYWQTAVRMPSVIDDKNGRASLAKTTPRAVYYRTVAPPPDGQGAEEPVS